MLLGPHLRTAQSLRRVGENARSPGDDLQRHAQGNVVLGQHVPRPRSQRREKDRAMSCARLAVIERAEGPVVRPAQRMGGIATHKTACGIGGQEPRLRAFSLAQAFTPGEACPHYSSFPFSPLQGALIGGSADLGSESMPSCPLKGTKQKRKAVLGLRSPGVNAWASEKARRQNRWLFLTKQFTRDKTAVTRDGASRYMLRQLLAVVVCLLCLGSTRAAPPTDAKTDVDDGCAIRAFIPSLETDNPTLNEAFRIAIGDLLGNVSACRYGTVMLDIPSATDSRRPQLRHPLDPRCRDQCLERRPR